MKTIKPIIGFLLAIAVSPVSFAQPGDPAANGLIPRSVTFYVNTNWNNNGLNSLGVDINSSNDVVIGFEDDNTPSWHIRHWAAVWTLYDRDGQLLTPEVTITNGNPLQADQPVTSIDTTYRSFFRADGSPTPGRMGWGPKIKANRYGEGFGMMAVSYALFQPGVTNVSSSGTNGFGGELPHLLDHNLDDTVNSEGFKVGESFPAVQLVKNDGTSAGLALPGGTVADYKPLGGVRNADWDYLANGNILIVGESRQAVDRALTGQTGGEVPVYRVLTTNDVTVKAYSAVSSQTGGNNSAMWHGAGVTSNGFAIRFRWQGRATMRLFDNNGNPTTDNIDIGTAAGLPALASGDRGDGTGFHGNGTDAYVYATSFNEGGINTVNVGVFNADGTLRWARRVANQVGVVPRTDRVDAAIHPDGRVVVTFDATNLYTAELTNRTVAGRMFDRYGEPLGEIFHVSEIENPAPIGAVGTQPFSRHSRVAWRGNLVAVVWESGSGPLSLRMVGARTFDTAAYTPVSPGPITGFTGTRSGDNLLFTWSGGSPPFKIEKKDVIDGSWSDAAVGLSYRNGTAAITGSEGYYRVVGQQP